MEVDSPRQAPSVGTVTNVQRLYIRYLTVDDNPCVRTRPLLLLEDGIHISFAREDETVEFIAPIQRINRVKVAMQFPNTIWVAIAVKQLRGASHKIVFSTDGAFSTQNGVLFEFLHRTHLLLITNFVDVSVMLTSTSTFCKLLVGTVSNDAQDARILAAAETRTERQVPEVVVPVLDEGVTIRFSTGHESFIAAEHLRRLNRSYGWISTDLLDAAVARMAHEEIPNLPFWDGRIVFLDSTVASRLQRFENLLKNFDINNYERILTEMYPKRGRKKTRPTLVDIHKEMIVMPVIIDKHWFLVLIHKPYEGMFNPVTEADSFQGWRFLRRTCRIIIVDSKVGDEGFKEASKKNHGKIFALVAQWLKLSIFAIDEFPHRLGFSYHTCSNIPTQSNNNDCGVYLLMFLEQLILGDWQWLDLADKDLEKMKVGDQAEFEARATDYRQKLMDLLREKSLNWPSDM